jgi:hypothetical protein
MTAPPLVVHEEDEVAGELPKKMEAAAAHKKRGSKSASD